MFDRSTLIQLRTWQARIAAAWWDGLYWGALFGALFAGLLIYVAGRVGR